MKNELTFSLLEFLQHHFQLKWVFHRNRLCFEHLTGTPGAHLPDVPGRCKMG